MSDATSVLKAILTELRGLRADLRKRAGEPEPERKTGGAEVTVVTRTGPRIGGVIAESEGDLLPRQIETATVEAGAMRRQRIVTRPK